MSSSTIPPQGPLGALKGMYWDAERGRYFPGVAPSSSSSRSGSPSPDPSAYASSSRSSSPAIPSHRPSYSAFAPSPLRMDMRRFQNAQSDAARMVQDMNAMVGEGEAVSEGLGPTACVDPTKRGIKRGREGVVRFADGRGYAGPPSRRPQAVLPSPRRWQVNEDRHEQFGSSRYATFHFDRSFSYKNCPTEQFTSVKAHVDGAFHATTDHGRVILHKSDGSSLTLAICSQPLVQLHFCIPRMTSLVLTSGAEPHVHAFRRDPENVHYITQDDLDLPKGDVFCSSSFDDICSVGGTRSITSIRFNSDLHSIKCKMPSDVMAVDQIDYDLVYAGLRSSDICLVDLRVHERERRTFASMPGGKAVVGIKRLKDSVVPWGLLASGMGDEMLVFDVRFGQRPLIVMDGHVNKFHSNLGLSLTEDHSHVFAAGSDRRIRCWSTRTGAPVYGTATPAQGSPLDPGNPLNATFDHVVKTLELAPDSRSLYVGVRGEIKLYRWEKDLLDDNLFISYSAYS